MKKCPKCGKVYDNTWGVCFNDSTKLVEAPEILDKVKDEEKKAENMSKNELVEWVCGKCNWKFNEKLGKRNFLSFSTTICPKCSNVVLQPYGIRTHIFMWLSFIHVACIAGPGYFMAVNAFNDCLVRRGDDPILTWTYAKFFYDGGWFPAVLAVFCGIGLYKNYELMKKTKRAVSQSSVLQKSNDTNETNKTSFPRVVIPNEPKSHQDLKDKHFVVKNLDIETDKKNEHLYLKASEEAETHNVVKSLWVKAITQAEGDENKAKIQYIKLRVNQLEIEENDKEAQAKVSIPKKIIGTISVFLGSYILFAVVFSIYQNIFAYIYKMVRREYSYTSITFFVGMGLLLILSILLIYFGANILKKWKKTLSISLMICGVFAFFLYLTSKETLSNKFGDELAFYSATSIGHLVTGITYMIVGLKLFFYRDKGSHSREINTKSIS